MNLCGLMNRSVWIDESMCGLMNQSVWIDESICVD